MTTQEPRGVMARAFRETALSLIGLYQIYEVDSELADATADALGRLFRRHLCQTAASADGDRRSPLHALVDEMDRVLGRTL
jgi:hypothetical protein